MTEKFKPLYYNPQYVYGPDFWNILAQDVFEFFWNSLTWRITGKFPYSSGHVIRFCGNPECYSLIAFYPDKRPSECRICRKQIDWE